MKFVELNSTTCSIRRVSFGDTKEKPYAEIIFDGYLDEEKNQYIVVNTVKHIFSSDALN